MITLRVALPQQGDVSAAQGLDEMLAIKPAYESCATGDDDPSGGREKRLPLREAQGSKNLDQYGHVCAGLDCSSRRWSRPQSQLDYQSRCRRRVLPTEVDRGAAGCTGACGGRV